MNPALLRMKVSTYYALQKTRVATGNRVKAHVREGRMTELEAEKLHSFLDTDVLKLEKSMGNEIENDLAGHPVFEHLRAYRGIGPVLAAGLLATIQDPARYNHVSGLWAYAGLHVVDGVAARRRRGEKANWNPFLKTLCWKVGESFVKAGKDSFYRGLYEEAREKYDKKEEQEATPSKARAYARAKRWTVKMFLAHVLEWWKLREGLPVPELYVHAYLGHVDKVPVPPEETPVKTAVKKTPTAAEAQL